MISSGALREKENNIGYYETLVNFPPGIPSPYENQIDLDLHRTFPEDPFFQKDSTISSLRNILLAYSRRNVTIGYCQGFNFIAGRIIKTIKNEEDSFWILVQLLESILPISYYSELSGIIVDTMVMHILLKMYHQEIYSHFVKLGYDISLNNVLYKWYVSLFIQNTNEELSFIIWDSLFLEGNIILFFASLAMFRILKYEIINSQNLEDLHILFDYDITKFNNKQIMYWFCIIKRFEFGYLFLQKHRIEYEKIVAETIIQNNKKRLEALKKKRVASYCQGISLCKKNWSICIYDIDYKYNNIINFLVFRIGKKIRVIENYFFEKVDFLSGQLSKISIKSRSANISNSQLTSINDNVNSNKNGNKTVESSVNLVNISNNFEKSTENKEKKEFFLKSIEYDKYLNLLIERREHKCGVEDEIDVEKNENLKEKEEEEKYLQLQASTLANDLNLFMRGDDNWVFKETVKEVSSTMKDDEKIYMEEFKESVSQSEIDFEI